jgi:hypothetical protein
MRTDAIDQIQKPQRSTEDTEKNGKALCFLSIGMKNNSNERNELMYELTPASFVLVRTCSLLILLLVLIFN